jgi:hypothetical protein
MTPLPASEQPDLLRRRWWPKYKVELLIGFGGLIAINLVFVSGAFRQSTTLSADGAAQLGAFVGGYVGTAFLLVSILLLVATLRNQRDAAAHQNFETKYFTLLELHRDNVAELELQNAKGRRVFVLILREFRAIHPIVRRIASAYGQSLSIRQLLEISYYCLYY